MVFSQFIKYYVFYIKKSWVTFLLFLIFGLVSAQQRVYHLDPALTSKSYKPHTLLVKFKTDSYLTAKTIGFKPENHPLVKKLKGKSKAVFSNAKSDTAKIISGKNQKVRIDKSKELSQLYFLEIDSKQNLEQAINLLLTDENIVYAEPVFQNFTPLYSPNDPLNTNAYHLTNIKAYEAWDIQKGNPSMVIGLVDEGFDISHEDLQTNLVSGWNTVENNTNVYGQSPKHGTTVAGVSSATPDNSIGITGVGFNCKYMPVAVTSPSSPGVFDGFGGLIYAINNGCKVVNLSWGRMCGGYSQAENDIIDYAVLVKDVVVVVSAGNTLGDIYWYPASYPNAISVAGTDASDYRAVWDYTVNYGCGYYPNGTSYNDQVDISAPAYCVYSTLPGNSYSIRTGTSFASPQVAAAAALVRVQFPGLSAVEVGQRIINTADDIYGNVYNAPLRGKLGVGRLNIYRALTEIVDKSVMMISRTIDGYKKQPYPIINQTSNLTINVTNFLSPLTDLQVKISTDSPYVTLQDSTSHFGAMNSKDTLKNTLDPFAFSVKSNTPNNTEAFFKLTFTDGLFTKIQYFSEIINPDYLDVNINKILSTVTSKGRIGYNDDLNRYGEGFVYKSGDGTLMYEIGLMVATSDSTVSDAVRIDSYNRNQSFTTSNPIKLDSLSKVDWYATGVFSDTVSNLKNVGVSITENVFAWKNTPDDKYFIQEYDVKNISGKDFPAFYIGQFADWDVQGYAYNQVDWDSTHLMGYVYNTQSNNSYVGIALLTHQKPQYYALDYNYNSGVWIYDTFTNSEKFKTLSSGIFRKKSTTNALDVSQVLGAKIDSLKNNKSQKVAFAFLAGDNLTDLQASATAAQNKYTEIRTSLLPIVSTVNSCKNDSIRIAPGNGAYFNFYKNSDATGLLYSGSVFKIPDAGKDTIFYVTGIDNLYESKPVAVLVKSVSQSAAFSNTNSSSVVTDTLYFPLKNSMNFIDQSPDAVKWSWDFGDGDTATEKNPVHVYKKSGVFMVKLTIESGLGCRATVSKLIHVLDLVLAVEDLDLQKRIHIYPNPTDGKLYVETIGGFDQKNDTISVFNTLGQKIGQTIVLKNKQEINISGSTSGMYFIKISFKGQILVKKIILN